MATTFPDAIREIFERIAFCVDSNPDCQTLAGVLNYSIRELQGLVNSGYGNDWIFDKNCVPLAATQQAFEQMGYRISYELDNRGKAHPIFSYRYVDITIFKPAAITH